MRLPRAGNVSKAWHILLTEPPAFAQIIGFSKSLLQEIPRLRMSMMANIVSLGIGGCDFESFRKVTFARPILSNFKVKLLRIVHGLVVGFGQRIIVAAQRVEGADKIEGRRSVRDAPDAGGCGRRRVNCNEGRCKQSAAARIPKGERVLGMKFLSTNPKWVKRFAVGSERGHPAVWQ